MPEVNIGKQSMETIAREVFNTHKIEAKTDLQPSQLEPISKDLTFSGITATPLLKIHLTNYMILCKSKDRGSMGEFVNIVRSIKESAMQKIGESVKLLG